MRIHFPNKFLMSWNFPSLVSNQRSFLMCEHLFLGPLVWYSALGYMSQWELHLCNWVHSWTFPMKQHLHAIFHSSCYSIHHRPVQDRGKRGRIICLQQISRGSNSQKHFHLDIHPSHRPACHGEWIAPPFPNLLWLQTPEGPSYYWSRECGSLPWCGILSSAFCHAAPLRSGEQYVAYVFLVPTEEITLGRKYCSEDIPWEIELIQTLLLKGKH